MKFAAAWLLLAPIVLAATARAESPEDARLDRFFRAYLDEVFASEPLTATRLGDHRFDDRLDDISKDARLANVERDRKALARLPKEVDYSKLSRDSQIDFEILKFSLERSIWASEHFKPFEDDPRIYGDYLTEGVYLLLTQSTLPKEQNLANAKARMALVPKIVDEARKTIGKAPRVKVETAIRQTKGAIGFYEDDLFTLSGEPKGEGELAERSKAIVDALKSHLAFLQGDVLARSDAEGWRIGKTMFDEKLKFELDAGLSADEVLAEAEAEANRVENEMALIARMLWASMFPREPLPPDDEKGRRAMVKKALDRIGDDRSTPDSLVSDARGTVAEVKAFIAARDILRLPDPDLCKVIEMPAFMRGNSTAYLNPSPPLDPNGVSEYAIAPPPGDWDAAKVDSLLREYNKAMLKILTIHEAYPGHYVQLAYSNRCPSLVRKVLSSGTFAEGWAVYTERMMLDQGFGDGDLRLRLQQLKFYLRAVVNAILDHRMHCSNMTDAEAMELLAGRAFQTEGEAFGKVIRSKQSSCQLSTYFVGRLAFYRLRQAVSREQGDAFDLGRFHEAVLAHGTLPVKYLPEVVRTRLKAPR